MEVFNKLYSSVSSSVSNTVSQLSGVLPGNPVTREYEAVKLTGSAGIGSLWKVYSGFKKSTKQEVSIFVLEKKQLERFSKEDRDNLLETFRRGVVQLTKIRHPHVLTVQHPLEESRESLAFATEPVYASLANVLSDNPRSEKKLFDVEIKHGILQLIEGLKFLHGDAKIVHRNLTPESIVINKQRSWKLFGFDFCLAGQTKSDGSVFWTHTEYTSSAHVMTQPSLEYTAPEVALNSIVSPENDLFAFGVLIHSAYSGGKPLKMFGSDYSAFRRYSTDINHGKCPRFVNIPTELNDSLKELLHASPQHRIKLHEFAKINFFQDVGVKTLNYLDSLYQWDNLQKSKFYKGLPEILPTLPHRVNLHCILPYLVKEFINSPMVPFVLPNVLLIAENSTQNEYVEHILPHLKPIMKLQDPIQILLIFMQKMSLLLKLTPAEEVKMHVLPLLWRSLECDMPQIQELCLNILPTFSALIDYNATKNALLPRIRKLCIGTQNVSVKVNCLVCIGKLLEDLDRWLVLDEILPFLSQITSREPAVVMAIIGIYKIALGNAKLGITKEVMATKAIPFLMPLCIENGLTVAQFNCIVTLIKDMVNQVEKEQREKLQQLNTVSKDNKPIQAADILSNEIFNKPTPTSPQSPDGDMFPAAPITVPKANNVLKLTTNQKLPVPAQTSAKPDLLTSLMNANLETKPTPKPMNNWNNSNNTSIIQNNQNQQQKYGNFQNSSTNPNQSLWNSTNAVYQNSSSSNNNNGNMMGSMSSLDAFLGPPLPGQAPVTYPTDPFAMTATSNLLQPQSNEHSRQNSNSKNLNQLSQQDILNFLN